MLLRYGKKFAGFTRKQPCQNGNPGYAGEGIWRHCPECGGAHPIAEPAQFRSLLEQVGRDVSQTSQALYDSCDISKPGGTWQIDPDSALFRFTSPDGVRRYARYGMIGSYNRASHSWMWGWAFPEDWMPGPARDLAHRLRDWGGAQGWQTLLEPTLTMNEFDAWHMTELAAHVAGYPMVYRAAVNDINLHYFAIDRPMRAH